MITLVQYPHTYRVRNKETGDIYLGLCDDAICCTNGAVRMVHYITEKTFNNKILDYRHFHRTYEEFIQKFERIPEDEI
jgi:hypothetical protein